MSLALEGEGYQRTEAPIIKHEQEQFKSGSKIKLYAVDENNAVTHLLVRGDDSLDFLKELSSLPKLVELTIQNCNLQQIPPEVLNLTNLTVLDLDNNNIDKLPTQLFRLKELTHLSLNLNELTSVPVDIKELDKLTLLEFNSNKLKSLPESFGQLINLNGLQLSENYFRTLPPCLYNLQKLEFLYIEDNSIESIPDGVSKLNLIEAVSLKGNLIASIDSELKQLTRLSSFDLSDNPITKDVEEIVSALQGQELIEYLLEIQSPDIQRLNEAKVLVVGDERVGKTSIINRIVGRELDENQKSTLGIDIQRFSLSNKINLNIWDFAGQEITHQTHQFFLSSRSLYLYVIDAQKEDNESGISHWLNTIKATAGDPPIIVVVNKRDLNTGYKFDFHRYKDDFNIVSVLYVSAESVKKIDTHTASCIENTIDDLISELAVQVQKIKGVKIPFPKSWLDIKHHIEEQKVCGDVDFIESSSYEKICEQHNLNNVVLQDALLNTLNQIGTVVTYRTHKRLNVMQIINPEWVTNGVYKILRSPLIDEKATLTKEQFETIFKGETKYQRSRHYLWLIDLIKQFQLAFSIDNTTVLIPARLESAQPNLSLGSYTSGLSFLFSYRGILKKNVISQFIVQMHEYVNKAATVKYWQRGVFLSYQSVNAVVISDEDKKTLSIHIDNANRAGRELLVMIRHSIRRINGNNLIADEQIPLYLDDKLVGFENYKLVYEAEQDGDTDIRCSIESEEKSSHKFSISGLLDGYRITDDPKFDYKFFEDELYAIACLETENRHAIYRETEDQINDRFRNALINRSYRISDQSRGGESESGKSAGERDLVVRNKETGIVETILESFILKSFDKTNIKKHLSKLHKKYDTVGSRFNYAMVFCKNEDFEATAKKYFDFLGEELGSVYQEEVEKSNVVKYTTLFRSGNLKGKTSHYLINFYSEQP